MKNYGLPNFEELKTSTRTVMVYCNMVFELEELFTNFPITKVHVPLTKKKKNVEKSLLKAPYGAIISTQRGIRYRGINLRRNKKLWCAPNCQTTVQKGTVKKKVNTVIEESRPIPGTDMHQIHFFCTQCERYYDIRELKKIPNFLNQTSIYISIGEILLHIMIFKDNYKIAGCKSLDDSTEVTMILWQDYITQIKNSYSLKSGENVPKFTFRPVMRNVDFQLGFYIDRKKLNDIMNEERYRDKIYMSQCEGTGHSNVNIKMYSHPPPDYEYHVLVFPEDEEPYFEITYNPPHNYKKPGRKGDEKFTTFIVFSSSEIILSGRYDENMRELYEFFVREVMNRKGEIMEVIEKPNIDLETFLKH